MNYEQYIASESWAEKRKARLELDSHRCRLCDEDGSRYQLEVHHRPGSYARIPNESVADDLITVCSRCHALITSAIREDRYGRREMEPTILSAEIQIRQENYGLANVEIQVDFQRPVDFTQRTNGGPDEQVGQIDQKDFVQKIQNGRGLRGDGAA